MSKLLKLSIICCALALPVCFGAAAQDLLPDGAGVEVVRDKCTTCHEADLIVQQRLTKTGWTREVEKMMRWGTEVTDAEKNTIIDYLSARFGPRPLGAAASLPQDEAGRKIFENKCLICHEADLTQQQRLTKTGWTREVDKMIRWGADVTDAERQPLIDWLTQNYGPRSR
jgi:cytochrome c5